MKFSIKKKHQINCVKLKLPFKFIAIYLCIRENGPREFA